MFGIYELYVPHLSALKLFYQPYPFSNKKVFPFIHLTKFHNLNSLHEQHGFTDIFHVSISSSNTINYNYNLVITYLQHLDTCPIAHFNTCKEPVTLHTLQYL